MTGGPSPHPGSSRSTLSTGYDKAATQLVAVLDGMGLRSRDGDVFDLTGPVDGPGRHLSSPTIALDPKTPAAEGFRAVLAHLAEAIKLNVPGTIDNLDPEFLHDLTRRRASDAIGSVQRRPRPPRRRADESAGIVRLARRVDGRRSRSRRLRVGVVRLHPPAPTGRARARARPPRRAPPRGPRTTGRPAAQRARRPNCWRGGAAGCPPVPMAMTSRTVPPRRCARSSRRASCAAQRQLLTAGRAITASTLRPSSTNCARTPSGSAISSSASGGCTRRPLARRSSRA